jgi:hypothetical protein
MPAFFTPITNTVYYSTSYAENEHELEDGLVPKDSVLIPEEQYPALQAGLDAGKLLSYENGVFALTDPVFSQAQQIAALEAAIEAKLNSIAQQRQYNSLDSAVGRYAASAPTLDPADPHYAQAEIWRKEANALKAWNTQVWAASSAYLAAVAAGTNPMPTPEQAVAMLPTFTWPT